MTSPHPNSHAGYLALKAMLRAGSLRMQRVHELMPLKTEFSKQQERHTKRAARFLEAVHERHA